MAKITVVGSVAVITSSLKLEDIKTIKKFRPEALVLRGGEDGKEPIFGIGISAGAGFINSCGIEFAENTVNEEGLATATMGYCTDVEDIRAAVADSIGAYVMTLSKLEESLAGVVDEIEAERQAIMENIVML